jgi:hypothetical protein
LNHVKLPEMISEMNQRGVKNFFITPVIVVPDIRPAAQLALSKVQLRTFIQRLRELTESLDDAYIEILLTNVLHFASLLDSGIREIAASYRFASDHLERTEEYGTSTFCIRFFPNSLVGTREFIVNTNGDVIAPLSMVFGKVPQDHIFGNLLSNEPDLIWERIKDVRRSGIYVRELMRERELLALTN